MGAFDVFLPPCPRADCPISPGEPPGHKHLLPNQGDLLQYMEDQLLDTAGYGSGKSVAAAIKGYLFTAKIRGNRGLILRETQVKLHDTALRMFLEVCERMGARYSVKRKRDGWPHHMTFTNKSEVSAYEFTDPGKFLGPEYGWVWVDEAIELPESIYQKIIGRIRLPIATGQRQLILTTNAPAPNHWLTRLFGAEPGMRIVHDPVSGGVVSYRRISGSSTENPALDPKYIASLRVTLPESEVARVLEGRTAFVSAGKPVYCPPFNVGKHVGEPLPVRDHEGRIKPMTRSWDFGFRTPAVLWMQIARCDRGKGHWRVFEEYAGENIEIDQLAPLVIDRSAKWKDVLLWQDVGDDAGRQRNMNGPGPIHRLADPPWRLRIRSKRLPSIDPGLALLRRVLTETCDCSGDRRPIFQVDRKCVVLIDALAGGYHYPAPTRARPVSEKPVKDGYYDNVADSLRYAAELVYRYNSLDPHELERLTRYVPPSRQWQSPIGRVAPPPMALVRDPFQTTT